VIAGAWLGAIGRRGEDLIAAGLLMFAGHVDQEELDKWVRVGWERRRGASVPYPDSEETSSILSMAGDWWGSVTRRGRPATVDQSC
jgi:hypothetical protein